MIQIQTVGSRFHVHAPFSLKERLKAIPGREWDAACKAWTYPATPMSAENISNALTPLRGIRIESDEEFKAALLRLAQLEMERMSDGCGEIPYEKVQSFDHQRKAFWLMARCFGDRVDGT